MYLHLGQNIMVPKSAILGIFDLDNTTWSFRTRRFLDKAEGEGRVIPVGDALPRSFVLVQEGDASPLVYLCSPSPVALSARAGRRSFE